MFCFLQADNFLVEGHVDEKQGTLTISSLKQEDEGEYICVATNKGGVAEKSSFLDVKGKFVAMKRLMVIELGPFTSGV